MKEAHDHFFNCTIWVYFSCMKISKQNLHDHVAAGKDIFSSFFLQEHYCFIFDLTLLFLDTFSIYSNFK